VVGIYVFLKPICEGLVCWLGGDGCALGFLRREEGFFFPLFFFFLERFEL